MLKVFLAILAGCFIWAAAHIAFTVYDGTRPANQRADAAIILGNTVHEDGSLSTPLKARVDKGLELFNAGIVDYIITSGGLGKEGHDEAEVMAAYLISRGVPAEKIIIDSNGFNTQASARSAATIAKDYGFNSIIAVSQYFHISRSKMLLRKAGFENVQGASPSLFQWLDIYSIPREFAAFYVDLILPL